MFQYYRGTQSGQATTYINKIPRTLESSSRSTQCATTSMQGLERLRKTMNTETMV
jgi:hypothetical protein